MALIVHYHTAVPASKRTTDAARKYPSYTTAQLEKFIAEGSGNAEMEAEVAARKAGASIRKVTPQIAPLGSRKAKDCGCGGHKKAEDAGGSYKVVRACRADVDNKFDVQLKVGETLQWVGSESSGSMYKRKDGTRVFVDSSDESCIQFTRDAAAVSAKDSQYSAKLTRDAGEPVNAAWLKLDRMTPDSLAREARSKGIKDETKTGQVMGILRAQFKPNQIEAWSQHF